MPRPQAEASALLALPTPSAWSEVFADFPLHSVRPGTSLLEQGAAADCVFLVRSGIIKLLHVCPDGRATIIGLRYPDSLLGVGAAFLDVPEPVTAVSLTQADVLRVPVRDFVLLVRSGGALSWQVHTEHCRELHRELEQVASLACLSARQRLREFLTRLVQEMPSVNGNGHGTIELPLRNWELAQLLAVTPEYLCRLMHELQDEGCIARVGARWQIDITAGNLPTSIPARSFIHA